MPKSKSKRKKKTLNNEDVFENPVSSMPEKRKSQTTDDTLVDKLMKKADSLVETFEHDLAKKFYKRVLETEPHHLKGLESLAGVHLELGEIDEAVQMLQEAVKLCPEEGFRKYFSLAQLQAGKDALELYRKGIQVLEKEPDSLRDKDAALSLEEYLLSKKQDLSNAYCAMAEIFMTDCCYEENAESECKSCLDKAVSSDESNPEAYLGQANFHLVKEEMQEAKSFMEKSLSQWLPKYKETREDGNEMCPVSFDSRVNASKTLLELDMFDEASDILDGLIDEDDEVVTVWYMLGLLNHLRGEDYFGNARFYFRRGLQVSEKLGLDEDEQVAHMKEILNEIGPGSDDDDDEEDKENIEVNSDDEYETMSEEEMQS